MPAVDITVVVNITWIQPNGQQISTRFNTRTNGIDRVIDYPYMFNRAQLGRYACVATLIPLSSNSNLRQSSNSQQVAQVFTGKIQCTVSPNLIY